MASVITAGIVALIVASAAGLAHAAGHIWFGDGWAFEDAGVNQAGMTMGVAVFVLTFAILAVESPTAFVESLPVVPSGAGLNFLGVLGVVLALSLYQLKETVFDFD